MSKRFLVTASISGIFIVAFALSATYFAIYGPATADQPQITREVVKISLSPALAQADVGKTAALDLSLSSGNLVVSNVIFRIEFDPVVVELKEFVKSASLGEEPRVEINNQAGIASFQLEFKSQVTGTKNLGNFVFQAKAVGETKVKFSEEIAPSAFAQGAIRLPATSSAQIQVQ